MRDLNEARKKIEEIDEAMAKLFEERMKASFDIALYKKENNLPVFDKTREEFLINKNTNFIKSEELKKHYQDFLISLMNISKNYQKENM